MKKMNSILAVAFIQSGLLISCIAQPSRHPIATPMPTLTENGVVPVESIEDQSRAAWARGEKPVDIGKRVRVIIYNPPNTTIVGSPFLSDSAKIVSGNKNEWLSENDMEYLSNDLAGFLTRNEDGRDIVTEVIEFVYVRDFPPKKGITQFTIDSYQICFNYYLGLTVLSTEELTEKCEFSQFDIESSLKTTYNSVDNKSACDSLKSGFIDEVWFWVMPGTSASDSYWLGLNTICKGIPRDFAVFVFSYDHNKDEMEEYLKKRDPINLTPFFTTPIKTSEPP
jgi:hypothetical protein